MQPMMINKPQDVYMKQSVMTASPLELIVMLYDGLKKHLTLGKRAIERQNASSAHDHLIKAQDIVTELIGSLDMAQPIAEELLALYEFILHTLEEANIKKDAGSLGDIIDIVSDLRSAWKEISATQKGTMSLSEE